MLRPALLLLSAGLLSATVATGCGVTVDDGPAVREARSVAPFQRIYVDGSPDVDVVLGDHTKVVVRGGRDSVAEVRTEVRDGTLHVDRESHDTLVLGEDGPRVLVEIPRLDGAAIHGSGDIDIDLAGRAADRLDLSVEGSGDVSASGAVEALDASVDGSGDLDLGHLHVARTLRARIDGSGDIEYAGHPQVTSDLAGAGELSRAD
jgi:hypothetical protein